MDRWWHRLNREYVAVALLALLGAVHVFVFSALFPFFQVTDELFHLDLAIKYSAGQLPGGYAGISSNAAPFCVLLSSPECLWDDSTQPAPGPLWLRPPAVIQQVLAYRSAKLEGITNHESGQPPLYYSLAGGWWAGSKAIGLKGATRVYALRCFNGILLMGTLLISWLAARLIFPENRFIRLAVPAIIAVQPQSVFYCISDDNLVALTFGLVFLLVLKFWQREILSPLLGIGIGLAMAAVFLTKTTNASLLVIAGLVLLIKVYGLMQQNKLRASVPALMAAGAGAGLPALAWVAWCKTHFGDWSGSGRKTEILHWTVKPVAEWIPHPLFSLSGCAFFIFRNIASFWQGEALWYRQHLSQPCADGWYVGSTIVSVVLVIAVLILRPNRFSALQRTALWFCLACLASLFLLFSWLSVRYDFHDCPNPSSAVPFFMAGRMMLGALIPALFIFAQSLDLVLFRLNERLKFGVLALLLLGMLATEIYVDHPVFHSQYSWINM